jgi:hypothetical protein
MNMQISQIQAKVHIIAIDNWQEYRRDGEQFLQTALRAHAKGSRAFSPDTLYNITAMAIEKYIMAFLMRRGDLAENHTIRDLAWALERHLELKPQLGEKLAFLDSFQDICDLHQGHVIPVSHDEVTTILSIGQEVATLLAPLLREDLTNEKE